MISPVDDAQLQRRGRTQNRQAPHALVNGSGGVVHTGAKHCQIAEKSAHGHRVPE